MDNVTHSLTGLMMARAGLGGRVKGATLMVVLAANAPDMDVVSWFGGSLTYLQHHREFTHAIVFSPLVAGVIWGAVKFIGRKPLGGFEYLAALLAVWSHLALDLTNVYGIRLFLPFSSQWLRLDMTDIVDPWILAILIGALAAPALVKLVTDEIGGRKMPPPKRGWAWFALVGLAAYEGARYTAHERAIALMGSHLYAEQPPRRVTAIPDRINPLRWRGVVEGEGFVLEVPVIVNQDYFARGGRVDYSADKSPAIDAARNTQAFQVFERFNQLPFWRLTPIDNGLRVELLDLRFGSLLHPGFEAVADVENGGHVRDSQFRFGNLENNPSR